ncbi:hypothetical protein BN961_02181 [Afipia felis]|uniref:Uncharacterized protein n=1 Tax=Afipia felis TaxID=1035 RepID=A0A090N7K5_AFIFE|nr:hypothetical protein BN961_02181 [Afipia felis]
MTLSPQRLEKAAEACVHDPILMPVGNDGKPILSRTMSSPYFAAGMFCRKCLAPITQAFSAELTERDAG